MTVCIIYDRNKTRNQQQMKLCNMHKFMEVEHYLLNYDWISDEINMEI